MATKLNTKFLEGFVSEEEIKKIEPAVIEAARTLHSGSGAGNDFIGWLDLPVNYDKEEFARIKKAAEKIKKCDVLIVIGIGGSYLGARAVIEAVKSHNYNSLPKSTPDIYFAGKSISADELNDLLLICEGKDVCVNVISKSGTTTEPALAFRVFRDLIEKKYGKQEAKSRIFVTTDKAKGTLKALADEEGFEECMKRQRDAARRARSRTNYMGADATVYDQIPIQITTEFDGYNTLKEEAKITVMTTGTELTEALTDGQQGTIVTDRTSFYGTMGGQVGDHGIIECQDGRFQVEETIHLRGGRIGHVGSMVSGMLRVGDTVTMQVNERDRRDTEKNHSATHLLQKALKVVLGSHVEQKGSYVDKDRLRFDFAHFQAMTPDELKKAEAIVNEQIDAALPVRTDIMSLEDARKTGAMALFDEKYGEKVRVVSMGDFSRELCGGTHVKNTSDIKNFKILSESGVAAGVRRIEALTGNAVLSYYADIEDKLNKAAAELKTTPALVDEKIRALQAELKKANSEAESLRSQMAQEALGNVSDQTKEVKGVKFIASRLEGVDMNGLRDLGDQLKEKLGEGVVVLASVNEGKVSLMATCTDGAVTKGAHAGNIIRGIAKLVGGGGGGRPNMAQAGGKNPEGIDAALKEAEAVLESQIK